MLSIIHDVVNFIVELSISIGYIGIFIGMFLESTIFPLPSELVMIPAGLAVSKGLMNFWLVAIIGTLGNVLGALFSYYIAKHYGRRLIIKTGKYFFFKEEQINKIEVFFKTYGNISVFFGRLLIGFRHFISLPAGLANMNIKIFLFYTTLGSSIWTTFLISMGYFFGNNLPLVKSISILLLVGFALVIIFFIIKKYINRYSQE